MTANILIPGSEGNNLAIVKGLFWGLFIEAIAVFCLLALIKIF